MNIQAPILTVDDFLRWNEGREGKHEFVNGRIVAMMTGGSRRHAELFLQFAMVLKRDLTDEALRVTAADFGVRTSAGIRYPDVLVHRGEGDGRELATHNPLLVAEILSPSSLALDFGEKAREYTALPNSPPLSRPVAGRTTRLALDARRGGGLRLAGHDRGP